MLKSVIFTSRKLEYIIYIHFLQIYHNDFKNKKIVFTRKTAVFETKIPNLCIISY